MLPIETHIPAIQKALEQQRCAVIQAPPGAGKTTRVPLALLDASWLADRKILLLEPRRLAAISCAGHMAGLLGETAGGTVGYRIRMESRVSSATRIEVVTEGIFTRKIQNDPSLEDVGLVIFDEFHERNLHSDVGLALCLDTFEALRPDLRVLVMSATMDTGSVAGLMEDAVVIVSKGKSYPVKTVYLGSPGRPVPIEQACVSALQKALAETCGDILVFLPGVGEIRRVHERLEKSCGPQIYIVSLYGNLPPKEQARAIEPSASGKRKIVLATAIAETSITIEGVETVVDTGLMRMDQFSWKTGMSRLVTRQVSRASADQRRGRSGRTGPGTCYRLWSEYDHGLLRAFSPPDILRADLSGVVLELASWGVPEFGQLKWLDLPDEASVCQARGLLSSLGALDANGRITGHGKKMASAGLHPRLSHMIIRADEKGLGATACRVAATLNERDFIRFDRGMADPDIRLRLEWIHAVEQNIASRQKGANINRAVVRRILRSEKKIRKDFGIRASKIDIDSTGRILAYAYPDRIAKKRDNQALTFRTSAGKGIFFADTCLVSLSEYVVAPGLDGSPENAKVYLGAPYSADELETDFGKALKSRESVSLDHKTGSVRAREEVLFDRLVVHTRILKSVDPDMAADVMIRHIRKKGLVCLPWTRKLALLRDRVLFLENTQAAMDLPRMSDKDLLETLDLWLKPFLSGIFSLKKLEKLDLQSAFLSLFTWEQQNLVEKGAPTHLTVPSGSRKPLKYRQGKTILDSPVLEVRLQEMFGLTRTPKIAGGKVAVTFSLLSPAGRPVQITRDIESFWQNTYKEVKKDLAGRYPKHYWPEDPLSAEPTSRAKPRKRS